MRQCPAPNCKILIPQSLFACRSHWFSISKEVRTEIYAAYRRFVKARDGGNVTIEELTRAAEALRIAHRKGQDELEAVNV